MKLIVNRGFDRAFTRITVLRNGQQALPKGNMKPMTLPATRRHGAGDLCCAFRRATLMADYLT